MTGELDRLRYERLTVWTQLKQLQDYCASTPEGMTNAHKGIAACYYSELEQLDARIRVHHKAEGYPPDDYLVREPRYDTDVRAITAPVSLSGGYVRDSPDVRYPKLVMDFEELVKAHHQVSINQPGSASQATREKAIIELDDEIKSLCEQLGYPYFSWKCITNAAGYPQVVYERPPRKITDELFTEITGLNPEDTYDGWREAFINTGLVSALEHMKEHVQ